MNLKRSILSLCLLGYGLRPLMGESAGSNSKLRCELRGDEHGSIYFTIHGPSHLHFLLFSDQDGISVYQAWNSWGYYARSFTAADTNFKTYQINHRQGVWSKNFPSTSILNKGEFLITDIYLCDGNWRVSPKLPPGPPAKVLPGAPANSSPWKPPVELRVVGHFQNQIDKDDMNKGVWTGGIESKPVNIFIDQECVEKLNAD